MIVKWIPQPQHRRSDYRSKKTSILPAHPHHILNLIRVYNLRLSIIKDKYSHLLKRYLSATLFKVTISTQVRFRKLLSNKFTPSIRKLLNR